MAAYGVAASSFWHMNPAEINVHIKGYEARSKIKTEEANINAWLIGAYVRIAIVSAFDSHAEYPEKPFGFENEKSTEPWQLAKMEMAEFAATVEKSIATKQQEKAKTIV